MQSQRPGGVHRGPGVPARPQVPQLVSGRAQGHVAVEPETGLITANTLTGANTPDGQVAVELVENKSEPVQVLADSAYGGGQTRADLLEAGHDTLIKGVAAGPTGPGGFDRDDFRIDYEAGTVTCPNNVTVTISAKGNASFARHCKGCSCVTSAPPLRRGAACASASTTGC